MRERRIVGVTQRRVTKRAARELRSEAKHRNHAPCTGKSGLDGLLWSRDRNLIENARDGLEQRRTGFLSREPQRELRDRGGGGKAPDVFRQLVARAGDLEAAKIVQLAI